MSDMVQNGSSDLYWTASPIGSENSAAGIRYSVSFRRSPTSDIDLHTLAEKYQGGGHTGAAGGTFELSAEQKKQIKNMKAEDKRFRETAYVCNLIAEDIARNLGEKKPAVIAEPHQDEPIRQIQEELKTHERHESTLETPKTTMRESSKRPTRLQRLYARTSRYMQELFGS